MPRPAFFDPATRILTIEGIMPTLFTSPQGNNSRFVIVQLHLSCDGKKLSCTSREIFEGTSRYSNLDTWSAETKIPYVFVRSAGDAEQYVFMFEAKPEGELNRAVIQLYDRDGRILENVVLFPHEQGKGKANSRKSYVLPRALSR